MLYILQFLQGNIISHCRNYLLHVGNLWKTSCYSFIKVSLRLSVYISNGLVLIAITHKISLLRISISRGLRFRNVYKPAKSYKNTSFYKYVTVVLWLYFEQTTKGVVQQSFSIYLRCKIIYTELSHRVKKKYCVVKLSWNDKLRQKLILTWDIRCANARYYSFEIPEMLRAYCLNMILNVQTSQFV